MLPTANGKLGAVPCTRPRLAWLLVDAEGAILNANPAFMRMFSLDDRGLPTGIADLGGNGGERVRRELRQAVRRAVSGRAAAGPIEISFGVEQGCVRRVYVSALSSDARERDGAILYAVDATEQKALELKFAQSHKMEAVGQLAGGVAHDFNNVLTAIIGFSDLLLQTHRPTDPAYRDIMNIKSSAHRAAGLVQQLLAFRAGRRCRRRCWSSAKLLTDLAPLLNRALGEKIELKILPGRDLWHIKADKTQFEQVIINLAVNAKDAMPGGGSLVIRTRNMSERESLKLAGTRRRRRRVRCRSKWRTPGSASNPRSSVRSSSRSSPPRTSARAPASVSPRSTASSSRPAVTSSPRASSASGTIFSVYLPRHIVESRGGARQPARDKKRESDQGPDRHRARAAGGGRGRRAQFRRPRAVAPGLRGARGRDRRRGARGDGARARPRRHRRQRRDHAGDGRADACSRSCARPSPTLKIIFVSGYPDDAFKKSLDENEEYAFLPKPFTLPQLAAKVKEQLGL